MFKSFLIILVLLSCFESCIDGASVTTSESSTTIIIKKEESSTFEFKLYFIPIPIILLGAGISGLCCCRRCRSREEDDNKSEKLNTMKRFNGYNGSNNKYSVQNFDKKRTPPVPPPLSRTDSTNNDSYDMINDEQYDSIETVSGYMSIQSSTYLDPSNQYDRLQSVESTEKSKNINKETDGVSNASGIRSFAEVTLSKPISTELHNFSNNESYNNNKEFHN